MLDRPPSIDAGGCPPPRIAALAGSAASPRKPAKPRVEWPTLGLLVGCYAVWGAATAFAADLGPWLAVPLAALAITLHSSLTHEVAHGHPFRSRRVSEALVFPAIGLFVPYERFRDTHLAHHRDETLTDPYDDPESNYLDPAVWTRLSRPARAVLRANNTLLGRIVLGPLIGLARFWRDDWRLFRAGEPGIARAYGLHALGLLPVLAWLGTAGTMTPPAYLAAAYLAMSVLKIRTFLEHRAHEAVPGRSVIIEDRGPLAVLFLNNNLHAVHHRAPGIPWYRLPAFYRTRRARFLGLNGGYRYGSYWEVFTRHLLRAKDPVPHPLMERPRDRA